MNKDNYCVIMAGGIGSRFWPMSRTSYPKQFIDILGTGRTLIQQTYDRLQRIAPKENIFVVTNEDYRELVLQQCEDMSSDQVLCEPSRRNTAPCVAYASYKIKSLNANAKIVVAPADHLILKEDKFIESINTALNYVENNNALLTLGIEPSRPDTGYGYIQFDSTKKQSQIKKVKTFTEKPNLELAKQFVESGEFSWNSGMFIWTAKDIITAFKNHMPELSGYFEEGYSKLNTNQEEQFIKDTYAVCKSISIDYGIMEKAPNVYVISADIGWSDLGTWGSIYTHLRHDENLNATIGKNVMLYDSHNCIVSMPKEKLVVLQGLDGYIVVESNNTLLVCKKEDEQKIKEFVTDIKIAKGEKFV